MQKVPQTSVAPTYKLTLPSEFVSANLAHLIDQSFDLTDKEGKDVWRVALLPRRLITFLPNKCMVILSHIGAFRPSNRRPIGSFACFVIAFLAGPRFLCLEAAKSRSNHDHRASWLFLACKSEQTCTDNPCGSPEWPVTAESSI